MTEKTTILWSRWIIPVVPEDTVWEDRGVVIRNGSIVDVIHRDDAANYPDAVTEDLGECVLLPGFVNVHTHMPMVLLRGVGDDMELMPWLEEKIWPLEGRLVSREFVADGTRHAMAEMIRSGTTCAKDQYFFPGQSLQVASDAGFRLLAGLPLIEFPTPWGSGPDDYLAKGRELLQQWRDDPLVGVTLSPHAPYSVSDESFTRGKALADEFGVLMDVHVHETAGEVERAVADHGQRPVARLARLGILDEKFLAVHMTALNQADIDTVAAAGASVAHCPESNLKLASGFCPVADLLRAGINVGIGTDGAASNNDLDMLQETRTAALLAKAVAKDPTVLPAHKAIETATLRGARALGLDASIGSLEPGKQADMIAISMENMEMEPLFNVQSQVVYAATRDQVRHVWVGGRRLLRNRELLTIDEQQVRARVAHWMERVTHA